MIVFIKTILFSFSQNRMDFLLSTMNQRNHQSRFYNLRNNLEILEINMSTGLSVIFTNMQYHVEMFKIQSSSLTFET